MNRDERVAQIERQIQLGNVRSAIDLALDGHGEPYTWARQVQRVARRIPVEGAIVDPQLKRRIRASFQCANLEMPDEVEHLLHEPRAARGEALFPVATADGGALLRFVVTERADSELACDDVFRDAVEKARSWVASLCGGTERGRLARAKWSVVPRPQGPLVLVGGSVSLAAFVAFASYVLDLPVPLSWAYTGVLGADGFEAVEPETIAAKCRALREHGYLRGLVCGGDQVPPAAGEAKLYATHARIDTLSWVFSLGAKEIHARLDRGSVPPPAASKERDALIPRVQAVLAATGDWPLSLADMSDALYEPHAWSPPLADHGVVLGELLRELHARGFAEPSGYGWQAGEKRREDEPRRRAAHLALATVFNGRRERTLQARRVFHLLAAAEESAHAELLGFVDLHGPEVLGEALGVLLRAERQAQVPWTKLLSLPAVRSPLGVLLHVAWSCAHLGVAFDPFARAVGRLEQPVDRVLWLQAVVETVQHLLLALPQLLSSPVMRDAAGGAGRLSARPSLGGMRDVVGTLGQQVELPPGADSWRDAMADLARLFPQKGGDIVAKLNKLHEFGAWSLVGRNDALGSIEETVGLAIAAPLRRAAEVGALALEAAPGQDQGLRLGGTVALQRGLVQLREAQAPLFYRGVIGGAVRWWSLADTTAAKAELPDVEPERLLTTPHGLAILGSLVPMTAADSSPERRVGPNVASCPTPLARAVAKLSEARPGKRLLAADLATGIALRLLAHAGFAHAGDPSKPQDGDRPWLRSNKRRLVERIRELPAAGRHPVAFQHLTACAREGSGAMALDRAVDALERLEHVAGPLASHVAAIDDAVGRVAEFLSHTAWTSNGVRMVGTAGGRAWSLDGYVPKPSGSAAGREGEVALLVGEEWVSLSPFVFVEAIGKQAHVFITSQAEGKSSDRLAKLKLSFLLIGPDLDLKRSVLRLVAMEGYPFDLAPRRAD